MTTTPDVYKIPKLSSDNYHAWAIRARAALVQKEVWEAINPGYGLVMTDEERKTNEKALAFLFLVVEDSYLDDIGAVLRAKEAWETLEEINTKYGILHVLQLMRDFFNVHMKKDEPMKTYLARLMDLHRKLEKCGYNFNDREVALIMLMGLPEPYEALITNLEHEENAITTKLVKSRLLVEEKRINRRVEEKKKHVQEEDEDVKALAVKGQYKTRDTAAYGQYRSGRKDVRKLKRDDWSASKRTTICFCCGVAGHIAVNCPRRNEKGKMEEKKEENESTAKKAVIKSKAFCVKEDSKTTSMKWYLDTGATDHMSSCKEKFTEFQEWASSVEVANKQKLQVEGIGCVELNLAPENGG